MTTHRSIVEASRPFPNLKYAVVQDAGRWFVYDTTSPRKWRFACPYPTRELAESFADRCNAIEEGQPDSVIAELRSDADRLWGLEP